MSWLFSRALVAAYSAATCWDGAPSAPLSVMPTPQPFWRNDKTMDASRFSRFGLTCAVLTADHGAALLTWYRAASRARTSAPPAPEPASTASALASGAKWRESSVRYCLATSSWRTHRCLFDEALPWSSLTLPRWGMTRSGLVYQHPTLERPISATASGWWPTPTVCGNHNRPGASKKAGWGLASAVTAWPTPTASLGSKGGRATPRKGREGGTLIEAVSARTWPTPAARDYRHPNAKSYAERGGSTKGEQLPNAVGGALNPDWVEWLMGWPIGWTALKPLAMGRFQEWRRQHSAPWEPTDMEIAA